MNSKQSMATKKDFTLAVIVVLSALIIPLTLHQSQTVQETRQRAAETGNTLYVSPSGSGDCSQASPCSLATANGKATPGTTILAASGNYNGNFATSKGGSASGFVTFKSQTKHGATIVGGGENSAVEIKHPYIKFQDFTITGDKVRNGILLAADNVEISGNHIHHITQWKTGNTGWKGGAGIDTGKSPLANVLIDGNLIHHVGAPGSTEQLVHGMYLSSHVTNGRVTNNVIYEVEDFGLHPYDETEASGWHFINNTIANAGRGILQAPNGVTRNNIVYNVRGASYDIRGSGNVVANNLAGGTGSSKSSSGVTSGDPMFVNAAGGDFHIKQGSPAIDKGAADGAPKTDYDGKARPAGSGIDMGAFEYGATASSGGTNGGASGTPSSSPSSVAPSVITPTLYCLGVPCPGDGVSPTGFNTVPSTNPGTGTNPSGNPIESVTPAPSQPGGNGNPCETNQASIQHDNGKKKKHKKSRGSNEHGGFVEQFIRMLMQLLEKLFTALGIPVPDEFKSNGEFLNGDDPCAENDDDDNENHDNNDSGDKKGKSKNKESKSNNDYNDGDDSDNEGGDDNNGDKGNGNNGNEENSSSDSAETDNN